MIELMVSAMVVAGIAGLVLMPLALMEIIRVGRLNRQLAERNALQAQELALSAGGTITSFEGGGLRWDGVSEDELAQLMGEEPLLGFVQKPIGARQVQEIATKAERAAQGHSLGWIIGNGSQWRSWRDGMPELVNDRNAATRYARRIDAEAVHANDEDAWIVEPF